jgi:excisionase family DNA binding protein
MNQTQLPIPNPNDWLTVTDTASLLQVARSTVYVMVNDGRLTPYRIGTMTVFWRPEVEALRGALALARPRSIVEPL